MLYYENKLWSSVLVPFVQLLTGDKEVKSFYSVDGIEVSPGDSIISSHSLNIDDTREVSFENVLGLENTYNDGVSGIAILLQEALYRRTGKEVTSWVFKAVQENDLILSALYSVYGERVAKHLSYSSYVETTNLNREVILTYSEKLSNYSKEIKKAPLVKERFRVIRYAHFIRFLRNDDISQDITTVSINARLRNSYLFVQGKDVQMVVDFFSELKSFQGKDGAYIMLPDELRDVSIDTIAKSLENV